MSALAEWRSVPDYEGLYEVSSLGDVLSLPRTTTRGGLLKVTVGKRGYPKVTLCKAGRQSTHEVHRLVAAAFLSERLPGQEVRHKDGDPLNRAATNLEYGTRAENNEDAVYHGTNHNTAKTHCPSNHAYDEANTRWYRGWRYCKACQAGGRVTR